MKYEKYDRYDNDYDISQFGWWALMAIVATAMAVIGSAALIVAVVYRIVRLIFCWA